MREAFAFVSGVDDPQVEEAQGHHGNAISILRASLRRAADVRAFWQRVRTAGLMDRLVAELESRLDSRGQLFLRFDKQEAYQGRLKLARHDDVVSARGKVAAYPARRDNALAVARAFFEEGS